MHKKYITRTASGFTLIEVLMSMLILSIGVLSIAGIFARGLQSSYQTQIQYIAQQKAQEAMETIFTARDTKVLTFAQIANVSQGGVFKDGPQPLWASGPDGLFGTQDDDSTQPDVIIIAPGPDQMFGTADDVSINLNPWMTRTILIQPTNTTGLNKITITMNWTYQGLTNSFVLETFLSNYS